MRVVKAEAVAAGDQMKLFDILRTLDRTTGVARRLRDMAVRSALESLQR